MKTLLSFLLLATLSASAQQTLLYTENFEQATHTFGYDSGWANDGGSNQWVVNNQYTGGGAYPNTTLQSNTVAGAITNAPQSNYLHIYDALSIYTNANFNPAAASDRFFYTLDGFCTAGHNNVTLAFFYLCEGNANAYGEMYYSANYGPWIKTGDPQYSNQSIWKYVVVNDTAFDNKLNLRIGFRWTNSGNSGAQPNMSFAMDDILCVGTVDQNILTSITLPSNTVCRGGALVVQWSLPQPVCDATFKFELSNLNGSFPASPLGLGTFTTSGNTTGVHNLLIPNSVAAGNCYRIRVMPMGGAAFGYIETTCFTIQTCPNVINTLKPLTIDDPDTACVGSFISIPFYSTGAFNSNNRYIAELADSAGMANNIWTTINSVTDRESYDPATGSDPGAVGGSIPQVPAGCSYYVRVRSTNAAATGSTYGPFCLKHCDIVTNNNQSISTCITDTKGDTATISIDINRWNNAATYANNNKFYVELLDAFFFNVVNVGGLGIITSNTDAALQLIVPPLNDLVNLGLYTGFFYMRIIADNSSHPWNANGTLVTLTIGYTSATPPTVTPAKSTYCNTEIAELSIDPFSGPVTSYEWLSSSINNGAPFFWQYNPLRVDLTGAVTGPMHFRVREVNFGCVGAFSALATLNIVGVPNVTFTGSQQICPGSEYTYTVPFAPNTFYEWTLTGSGQMVDTSNNEIILSMPTAGTATLGIYALNACGPQTGTFNITATPSTPAQFIGLPTDLCIYREDITLYAMPAGGTFAGTGVSGNTFSVALADTGTHELTYVAVDSSGCAHRDTATIIVSACTGIGTADDIIRNIYPNPATTKLHITTGNTTQRTITLQLLTTTGKPVLSETRILDNEIITLDITEVPNGTYVLKVFGENEFVAKVVVMK